MAKTLTNLLFHVVFSTKGRRPSVATGFRAELHAYIGGIIRSEGAIPLAVGGVAEHVHLALKVRPDQRLSDLVRAVKAHSSKWVNESRLAEGRFAWQNGYGAFTVSASLIGKVRAYIADQEQHHRKRSYQEELLAFLDAHGMGCVPERLWD